MSIKSNKELEGELELAAVYRILPRDDWRKLASRTIDIRRGVIGLRKKVLRLDQPGAISHAKRRTHNANRQPRGPATDRDASAD